MIKKKIMLYSQRIIILVKPTFIDYSQILWGNQRLKSHDQRITLS